MIKLNAIFKKKNVLQEGNFAYKRKRKSSIMKWLLLLIIGFFLLSWLFEDNGEDTLDGEGIILNRHQKNEEVKVLKREIKIERITPIENKILIPTEEKEIAQIITPRIEYLDKVLQDSQNAQNER